MDNKELIKNRCNEYISQAIDDECVVGITVADKIKIQIGEDFYIFDAEGKIGYVKFRGAFKETDKLIRKMSKCIVDHKKDFIDFLSKSE